MICHGLEIYIYHGMTLNKNLQLLHYDRVLFEITAYKYLKRSVILYNNDDFYPTALRAVWVLFPPMASRWWADGWREKACLGCIAEAVK